MEAERGVVPLVAPLRLIARQADEVAKSRGEDPVALVDDILRVAQEMGEADLLLFLGPAGLGAVAVGDPGVRADVAEELLNRVLGASGMGQEESVLAVMENPQPPASLVHPQAGLVGANDAARQELGADGGAGRGEALARASENVDESAFADGEAEQVAHQARQPLEGDPLGEAQIEDEGAQVGAERRAGLKPCRRLGLKAPGATRAHASMQAHARDLGRNRRNLDAVIDLARLLRALRDVGPAMPAYVSENGAPMRRVGRKRPMRAPMGFLLAAVLDEFGRVLVAPARRDAGIIRRLGRTIELRPQIDDLRPECGDLLRLTLDRLRLRQGDIYYRIRRPTCCKD